MTSSWFSILQLSKDAWPNKQQLLMCVGSVDKSFVGVVMDMKSTCLVILYKYKVSVWNSGVNLSVVKHVHSAAHVYW